VAKAAKAEQQVAVCVLKVLLLPGADTPAAVAAAAAAATTVQPAAAAAGKGSIRSFFKPAAKQQQPAAEQQQQQQVCEADLVAAGAAAHYLLVQRPETGVLAGLWEFPGALCELLQYALHTAELELHVVKCSRTPQMRAVVSCIKR
jgi:adenine-specific DNA glycosylase